jgi:3'(2'), 5'-bisphosphate nucleotidase
VHIPVTDTTYSGISGAGAWRETGALPAVPIFVNRLAATPLRVLGSRSHGSPKLAARIARLGPHEFIPAGSSIKLCLIADGSADLYPRLGGSSEWDIAAGQAIVEAAGGQVISLADALALRYNKADLLNPKFLAYGDPALWQRWPRD